MTPRARRIPPPARQLGSATHHLYAVGMVERMQLLLRLERVMEETEFGWSLLMVGEDQSRKLADLTNDLKRPYSTPGTASRSCPATPTGASSRRSPGSTPAATPTTP